jgi:polysaccharide export outer membrane protein
MSYLFTMKAAAAWALLVLVGATGAGAAQDSGQKGAGKSESAPVTGEYRIGPGDVLRIDVWKEPDASMAATVVRFDGKLSLPLIGQVEAGGLTPAELQNLLAEKYGTVIREPRVTVMVTTPNNLKVYILGEVRREGSLRLEAPLTVLQALAESGGLTDYANRGGIYILRIENNQRFRLPFDYNAVVKGRKSAQNVLLQPGDTVVVPR